MPNQQDLITQLYFKGDKYVKTDKWASAPQAVNRILDVSENKSGVSEIVFNVTMSKEIPLEKEAYNKITGLYRMDDKSIVEFMRNDDNLFMKHNGQLTAGLKYLGNNTFEGGIGFPKVSFELLTNGGSKAIVTTQSKTYTGEKYLKYSE